MDQYFQIANRLINLKRVIDYWRFTVFVVRSLIIHERIQSLMAFFTSDPLFKRFSETYPCVYEQATRQVFYRGSSPLERSTLIMEHLRLCTSSFTEEAFNRICYSGGLPVWSDGYNNESLSFKILFDGGMKKEGLLGITFNLGETRIYQINFWNGYDKNGKTALYVGALQGQEGELSLLRELTKHFHGYRPKNLILRVVRLLSRQMELDGIYAVSDYGYYTNNHYRLDRKLKTSLDEFWLEAGGTKSDDPRFFELGKIEHKKDIEDIKSSKRSLYRKRFAMLDAFDADITEKLKSCLKNDAYAHCKTHQHIAKPVFKSNDFAAITCEVIPFA